MQRTEQTIQRAIVDMLRRVLHPDEVVFSAIGHGGGGLTRGKILKSMGLLPGLGDLVLMWSDSPGVHERGPGKYSLLVGFVPRILWLEVKSPKGRQSPEQREFQRRVVALGHRYHLVHSPEETYEALRKAGCPMRAVRFMAGGGYRFNTLSSDEFAALRQSGEIKDA